MFKIPSTEKKWVQTNKGDFSGNIHSSKCINLDEFGKLKLSHRSISLKSENGDTNFDVPTGVGIYSAGSAYLTTADQPYLTSFNNTYSVTEDTTTGNPSLGIYSSGKWWQNRWYATTATGVYYNDAGTWSASVATTTTGYAHPLEVFRNRNTLVIGNVNVVTQLASDHSASIDLTLTSNLSVVNLVWNNNNVGIVTKRKQGIAEKNNAMFFVWNGQSTSAGDGYDVGSEYAVGVTAFKNTWVILTDNGRLLRFNGGGFDELGVLPFNQYGILLGSNTNNSIHFSRILKTQNDRIYINITSDFTGEINKQQHLPSFVGGIYCYDDTNKSLYHKYAPSISSASTASFTSIDVSTNIITMDSTTPPTGTPVQYASTSPFIGLVDRQIYYIIKTGTTTCKLATNYSNAVAGTAIDISGTTSSANKLFFYTIRDFGQSRTLRSGVVEEIDNESYLTAEHLMFGSSLIEPASISTDYAHLNTIMGRLENRGWFVTPRFESENIKDVFQKLYLKFKPLENDIDKIIIKYRKTEAQYETSYNSNTNYPVTWTALNTFTTTQDLSSVGVGYEVEIIGSAGAGQIAHISTITLNAGTYTVVLDESMIGVAVSDVSSVSIENWTKLKVIDSSYIDNADGFAEIALGDKKTKWMQFKIELRGIDVTIEELQVINDTFKPSK